MTDTEAHEPHVSIPAELERLRAELAEKSESLAYYQKRYSQILNALKCPQCGSKYFFALTADTHWCCENCKHTWPVQEPAELAECRRLLRKHRKADKHPEIPGYGWCPECGSPGECDEGCAWEAAMKGGEA